MSPRLPLGDLDQAAQDPVSYRAQIGAPSNRGFSYGYFSVLRNAIRRFHNTGEDTIQARTYLEVGLAGFKDASRRTETMGQFDWYVDDYRSKGGWVTAETMRRIVVDTPPQTSADLVISGEISRLDIVPSGGYAAWLFRNSDVQGWYRELRMPLIQDTLAHELSVSIDEVMVGVYGFRQQVIEQTTYSVGEIRSAHVLLERLLSQLGF